MPRSPQASPFDAPRDPRLQPTVNAQARLRRIEAERRMLDALPAPIRPSPTLAERLTLPALLLLAWILFELTASATLSLLAACVKFGWEDFRTAVWLRRVDPNSRRGRACCSFYAASGIWKTALAPILVVMVGSLALALAPPQPIPMEEAIAWQAVSAVGVGLAAAALLVLGVALAVTCTLAANLRVWVHHELHRSRRKDIWPPEFTERVSPHENRGRAILATALVFAAIGLPPLVFPAIIQLGPKMETLVALTLVFGVPISATTLYAMLRGRIFAHHPWQCWPESAIEQSQSDLRQEPPS